MLVPETLACRDSGTRRQHHHDRWPHDGLTDDSEAAQATVRPACLHREIIIKLHTRATQEVTVTKWPECRNRD